MNNLYKKLSIVHNHKLWNQSPLPPNLLDLPMTWNQHSLPILLVIPPITFIPCIVIFVVVDSFAMLHVIFPLTLVIVSIFECIGPETIFLFILELANIGLAILVFILSLSESFAILLIDPFWDRAVNWVANTSSACIVIMPDSLESITFTYIGSFSMEFIIFHLTTIYIAVRELYFSIFSQSFVIFFMIKLLFFNLFFFRWF